MNMVIIVTRELLANRLYMERPHTTRMLRASDYCIRGVLHFLERCKTLISLDLRVLFLSDTWILRIYNGSLTAEGGGPPVRFLL